MKKILLLILLLTTISIRGNAQWLNPTQLSDMNSWSSQSGYIGWYNTASATANTPTNGWFGYGIQMTLPVDNRFGSQLVIPAFDDQIFYRTNQSSTWSPWYQVWSTANLDPDTYLDRSVPSIITTGSANSFTNGYTFAYAVSGTPWNGSLISFGGLGGSYDTQISSDYAPSGGKHISFRTMNGDIGTWNSWYELYHSGNLNRSDVNFTAQDINCNNVYTNGRVGIGTSGPLASLDIATGALRVGGGNGVDYSNQGAYAGWNGSGGGGETDLVNNMGSGGTGGFAFNNISSSEVSSRLMTILGNGNVGIGTTDNANWQLASSTYKLAVGGNMIAEDVTVKLQTNWPDYVFKSTYYLRPLSEVKTYINKNQHLPEIPTAAEVEKNGLDLGEMNKLLMKKVEELTLVYDRKG